MPQRDGSTIARYGMSAVWIVLLGIVFVYPLTLNMPLLDPDEGLHASIAQGMVERNDWIVPQFLGKPFLDKPILYFWAEALSLRVFGMHEAAVRFPGLMFGLLGAVTTGIVAWRMFGRTAGIMAGLFYTTMILPVALAQAAAHDVALVPWVNLAVLLFWESDRATTWRMTIGYTVAIGVLLGLACLTKGLVGVAVVGLVYGSYLLAARRLTLAACGRGVAALAIAALIASPWYIALEFRSPGYLYYYFVERHVLGYVTSQERHGGRPWWYYLPILLGGGLPWIAYLPAVVQDQWAKRGREGVVESKSRHAQKTPQNVAMILMWCWLIGPTLFFSVANSKMVTYIWPVFPAVAILAAVGWTRLFKGALSEGARRCMAQNLIFSSVAGVALLPTTVAVVQHLLGVEISWRAWVIVVAVALTSLGAFAFWLTGRLQAALSASALSLALHFAAIMAILMPHVAAANSARELAYHFNRRDRIPHRLLFAETRIGSFVFYLDTDLRAQLQEDQLQQVRLRKLPSAEPDTVIVVPLKRADRADRCEQLAGRPFESIGRFRVYDAVTAESSTVRND